MIDGIDLSSYNVGLRPDSMNCNPAGVSLPFGMETLAYNTQVLICKIC
ncbi:hypothetical protein FACS189449_11620 [Alphaproteobacteria bacterium]|nr:hypothetical protein FACS189449_11620 [Alphaproteobacteria bacterium]